MSAYTKLRQRRRKVVMSFASPMATHDDATIPNQRGLPQERGAYGTVRIQQYRMPNRRVSADEQESQRRLKRLVRWCVIDAAT